MNIDLIKLKALATAAAANQYDGVALNDYGTALPPATVLGLIAEIERHRQVNADGCKPENIMSTVTAPAEAPRPHHNVKPVEMTRFREWRQQHSTVDLQASDGVEA